MNKNYRWIDTIRLFLEVIYFVTCTAHAVLAIAFMLTG